MKKLFIGMVALLTAMTTSAQDAHQVQLTMKSGDVKLYDVDQLKSIEYMGDRVAVTQQQTIQDVYDALVTKVSFVKKQDGGQDAVIANGCAEIFEARGWQESAYVKWHETTGAVGYQVSIRGEEYEQWTKIDPQLIRNYGTYLRADVVGLRPGRYAMKVEPVFVGDETPTCGASFASEMVVKAYDRSGFAHFNYDKGVGAYNNDGTLKANAVVIYVTSANAKTVKARLSSGEFTGLQAIVNAYQKGNVTTPLAVRFIGTIKAADVDSFGSSEEGIQVKGKNADSELNITFEGIGDDATIYGFGFLVRNSKSVEFRNFAVMRCMDDGISLDTDNSNVWLHNIDVFYGKHGSGDHAKGDGAIDVKSDSKYVTLSYCRFWDTGKSNMFGMKSESGPNYITYHHNWFDHSDSRHPRIRTMSVHAYNNYFDGNSKYGIGVTSGASCFAENNYFRHAHDPLLSSKQGTDARGSGTFSGEDGGIIKSFGNLYRETGGSSYYQPITWQQNNTSFDCYEAATRDEQVPANVKTLAGGTSYHNFDTDPSLMYTYTPDAAQDVPDIVTGYYGAGRLNHGDCQFAFNNAVDDTAYDVNAALESLIDGYKTALVGIYGEDSGQGGDEPGGGDQGGGEVTPQPEGTIFCTFDKSGTPSNDFFTVVGNGSNSKGTATIDGETYDTCLKMESSTNITFTLSKTMLMTLYFGDQETASIKVDGVKKTSDSSTYSQTLDEGQHVLTKADSRNLFGIKLEPVE